MSLRLLPLYYELVSRFPFPVSRFPFPVSLLRIGKEPFAPFVSLLCIGKQLTEPSVNIQGAFYLVKEKKTKFILILPKKGRKKRKMFCCKEM